MALLESMVPRPVDFVAAATLLDAAELDELAAFGLAESILDELKRAHATDGRDGFASGFLKTPQLPNVFGFRNSMYSVIPWNSANPISWCRFFGYRPKEKAINQMIAQEWLPTLPSITVFTS
jgi:hypothetical protein